MIIETINLIIRNEDVCDNCMQLLKYDLCEIEKVYLDYHELDEMDSDVVFHHKLVLLCAMVRDETLCQKYNVITKLEQLLSAMMSSYNCYYGRFKFSQLGKVEVLQDFDILTGEFYDIFPLIYIEYPEFYKTMIGYFIINKSSFLDKFALLCFYRYNFVTSNYEYTVLNKLPDIWFSDELKQALNTYLKGQKRHKIPLCLAFDRFIRDDIISWNLVESYEYVDYLLRVDFYKEMWSDFLLGNTNFIDMVIMQEGKNLSLEKMKIYGLNITFFDNLDLKKEKKLEMFTSRCTNEQHWFFCSNIVHSSGCFSNVFDTDLQQRIDLLKLLFCSRQIDIVPHIINCSKFCDNFKLSTTCLFYIDWLVYKYKSDEIRSDIAKLNLESPFFKTLPLLYASNPEFMRLFINRYRALERSTKAIIILAMGNNIDLYKDDFIQLNDTSDILIDFTIFVYQKHPQLAEGLLLLFKNKKVEKRKLAFMLLTKCYPNKYFDEIKTASEVERTAKFKKELELFVENSFNTNECLNEN